MGLWAATPRSQQPKHSQCRGRSRCGNYGERGVDLRAPVKGDAAAAPAKDENAQFVVADGERAGAVAAHGLCEERRAVLPECHGALSLGDVVGGDGGTERVVTGCGDVKLREAAVGGGAAEIGRNDSRIVNKGEAAESHPARGKSECCMAVTASGEPLGFAFGSAKLKFAL